MSDIKKLTEMIIQYRDERDWKQFHNPKDLAISLALEAAEVLEHFQWKSPPQKFASPSESIARSTKIRRVIYGL